MFFYEVFTKVGSAVVGWINENYPKKKTVKPRVYHKYIKQEDKNRLYPELNKEEDEADIQEEETAVPTDKNSGANVEDTDEDPLANV